MAHPPLRTKRILTIALLLLLLVVIPATAAETPPPVVMQVEPALQGHFKYGEWLPVWVNLENHGTDFTAEVRVSVRRDFETVTYAVPVSLANGARKRVVVYVLPNNFTHELKVDLVADDEVLYSQKAAVQPQPNINYLIGVAAQDRGALALVPSIQLPGRRLPVMLDLALATLPEQAQGLRALDCLILNNIDSSNLTPEQVSALIDWVRQGGRLVLGGGAGAFQTLAGFPREILPLAPTDLTELETLEALATFADTAPVRVPGPFVIATGEETQGKTLAQQDHWPLVQEAHLGNGYITFVALDLSTSPFDAWTGTTAFWETLITPGAAYPDWMPPDMSGRQMASGPISNALANLPSLDLPSVKSVAILLVIYIVLVGPINYFILRWRQKLHWGWVTIPLITILFSALSFGIGYAKRGNDLLINKVAIIQGAPGGDALVNSYIGLFSPANQSYEIEVSGENLLSPMSGYYDPWSSTMPPGTGTGSNLTFVQSNPSRVRGLTVNQWSMQSFMTETRMDGIGELKADLDLQDGKLLGTVTNETGYALRDVVIVLRPRFLRLGDLEAGASTEVALNLNNLQTEIMHSPSMSWLIYEDQFQRASAGPPPRELEFKRMVLEVVLDQQTYYGSQFSPGDIRSATALKNAPNVTLFGWLDTAPPEVRVNGQIPQETTSALFITEAQYQFPDQDEISIPVGLIPGLVTKLPFSGGACGPETSVWIEKGEADFEFILPPEIADRSIDTLLLSLRTDSGFGNPPALEIYDWEAAAWQPITEPILGINQISATNAHISPEGLIRFKFSANANNLQGGACYFMALGLESSR